MSGGHFDHQQYVINDIADSIQHEIDINDSKEPNILGNDTGRHYSPEVIKRFKKAVAILKKAGDMAHEVDWLLSDDTGPETFLELWKKKGLDDV